MKRSIAFYVSILALCATLSAQGSIGISVGHSGLFPTVSSIKPGSPAALAGVPLNGAIMRIDSKEGFMMKAKEARKLLPGPVGSEMLLVVTGINRTDTFRLTRQGKGKPQSGEQAVFCRALSDIFLQLQVGPLKLRGTPVGEGLWQSKKGVPGAAQTYFYRSTMPGTIDWAVKAVMAISHNPEDLSAINTAFSQYLPVMDACLAGWKRTVAPDMTYLSDTEYISWERGNSIILFGMTEKSDAGSSVVYSLDLKVLSLK